MSKKPSTNLEGIQRDEKGRIVKGAVLNPEGVGGFGERPEDRSDGRWDAENTFTYQMNKFKRMTVKEIEGWSKNTPKEIRTVAQDLAFNRVINARNNIQEFREVADRTEGKAPQVIKHQGGISIQKERLENALDEILGNDGQDTEDSNIN